MKEKGILLLIILLTGALVNSTGFVLAKPSSTESKDSDHSEKDSNHESNDQESDDDVFLVLSSSTTSEKVTLCHIPPGNPGQAHTISVGSPAVAAHLAHGDYEGPCVNENSTTAGTNSTASVNSTATVSSVDDVHQYVSEFVKEHITTLKNQRTETINAIKICREKVRNADDEDGRKAAQVSCKATLKDIRAKYKAEREEYKKLFKEYRDSLQILIKAAKGKAVSNELKEKAVKDIGENKQIQFKIKEQRQAEKGKKEK
ncbi:MAG TPA: hypothetical protein VLD38_00160 [Nitrosopumilaceae archaeon]|nr:hypothetical protein [Nitrosopumilaceae archaeon]